MPTRLHTLALLLSTMLVNSAVAQYPAGPPAYQAPVQQANAYYDAAGGPAYGPPVYAGAGYGGTPSEGRYPQLNAPLYPSPVQNTPANVGRTMITNQAFAPHEMLYPHNYNAMYGPFYYSVRGGWFWTPFGMRQHENWKLEGTQVQVKYRSQVPLLSRLATFPHSR